MNINTVKLTVTTLLVHLMCFTVVLSHLHAKDAVSALSQQSVSKTSTTDITAKVIGDLHHHIDKAGLKNIHIDNSTVAARSRELNPLQEAESETPSLATWFHDFLLRFRIVASLCYQYA